MHKSCENCEKYKKLLRTLLYLSVTQPTQTRKYKRVSQTIIAKYIKANIFNIIIILLLLSIILYKI